MGAVEAFRAVDDEGVVWICGDGGVLGGEGDVEAADAEIGVLDVEVVGIAHGTVLGDGDADAACEDIISKQVFPLLVSYFHRKGIGGMTYCLSIG